MQKNNPEHGDIEADEAAAVPYRGAPLAAADWSALPDYLVHTYWWAYLHPLGIRVFERQWLVNAILWGNYRRLRDAALAELPSGTGSRVLQLACVYGDLTERLLDRLGPDGQLDVVDVAPAQLDNLRRKLAPTPRMRLFCQDSTRLQFDSGGFDSVLLFFLLHEQPHEARANTLRQALRVLRPGGRLVVVDYHRAGRWNPVGYLMAPVFAFLEPFAAELCGQDIRDGLPADAGIQELSRRTYFGGLYQKVVFQKPPK